jgi:hypothetical protein
MNIFFALLHYFMSHPSAAIFPDISKKIPPIKLASAEGSFVSSTEKAASAWANVLTCSQHAFSKAAATPLAPENAQTSPRSLKSFDFTTDPLDDALRVALYEVVFV